MYCLRLSPNYEYFEDIFQKWCNNIGDEIERNLENLAGDRQPENKEYVWTVGFAPGFFKDCMSLELSREVTINEIKKSKDIITNQHKRFVRSYNFF